MVKIDGGRVRQLREQKSLTQLYLATAVQVTTDTISRWENRRYPTIKRENAIKLAEALEVELDVILERQPDPEPVSEPDVRSSQQSHDSFQKKTQGPADKSNKGVLVRWPILLLSATMAAVIALVGWVYFHQDVPTEPSVSASRSLPAHCTPGQVFPVNIEVSVKEGEPLAFIVKEQLPAGVTVVNASPPLSNSGQKGNTLKWLKKGHGTQLFTYAATIEHQFDETDEFTGGIAVNDQSRAPSAIIGDNTILVTTYHWADSNRDRVISDSEILSVYDQFGEAEQLGIDLDLLEEIWLGSGYSWNPDTKSYDILP